MMSLLKNLDIFGVNFQFNINGQYLMKSEISGFLSIILIISTLVFALLNLTSLIERKNIFITNSQVTPNVVNYTQMNESNIVFAFSLTDSQGNTFYSEKLKDSLTISLTNNILQKGISSNTTVNYFPCNASINYQILNVGALKQAELFCVNFSNIQLGGNVLSFDDSKILNFKIFFNQTNFLKSNNVSALASVFPLLLKSLYNVVELDLINFKNPVSTSMTGGLVRLFYNLSTAFYVKMNKIKIITDVSYFTTNSNLQEFFSMNDNWNSIINQGDSRKDPILNMRLSISPVEFNYYRSYMKIQDLLNNVNSFFSILFIITGLIGGYFNNLQLKLNFIEENFFVRQVKSKYKLQNLLENINQIPQKKDIEMNNIEINKNDTFEPLKIIKKKKKLLRDSVAKKNTKKCKKSHFSYLDNIELNSDLKFGKSFFFQALCCFIKNNEKDSYKFRVYDQATLTFNKFTDIYKVINLIDQFENLKYFFLNHYQNNLLNHSKMIVDLQQIDNKNLNNKEDIKNFYMHSNDEAKKFLHTNTYFKDRIDRNNLTKKDLFVMNRYRYRPNIE